MIHSMVTASVSPLSLILVAPVVVAFGEGFIAHLRDPRRLRSVMREVGVPHLAWTVTAAEGVVLMLLAVRLQWGGFAAAAFVIVATAIVLRAARQRPISDCGCSSAPKPISRQFLGRNALLVSLALAVAALA